MVFKTSGYAILAYNIQGTEGHTMYIIACDMQDVVSDHRKCHLYNISM